MHGLTVKHLIISILLTWILILNFVKTEEDLSEERKVALNKVNKGKLDKYAILFKDFLKIVGKKFLIKKIAGLVAGSHHGDNGALKVVSRKKHDKKHQNMMPVAFHMGAASTWMVVTALLAAKSVAIGLTLLVIKIALSSAKVAAFFTSLKHKQIAHDWSPPPPMHTPPYYEHGFEGASPHGYDIPIHRDRNDWFENHKDRSLPEWTPDDD